jgi:hypothetical protein
MASNGLGSPNGAKYASPGQRPGIAVFSAIQALKGRNRLVASGLFRPFRACQRWFDGFPRALPWANLLRPFGAFTVGILVFGLMAVIVKGQDDAAKKDLKLLQGTWIIAGLEVNGALVPANKLEGTVLTIKNDRYIVKVKDIPRAW